MFDYPTEDWYAYLGVSLVSVAVFATVTALPTAPPPDADVVATTVDRVAAGDAPATGTHPLPPGEIRVTQRSLALRTDGGVEYAPFAFGPVVPVDSGSSLARVVAGDPPSAVFASPEQFDAVVASARERDGEWRETRGELRVRHVSWGGVDVTLVVA